MPAKARNSDQRGTRLRKKAQATPERHLGRRSRAARQLVLAIAPRIGLRELVCLNARTELTEAEMHKLDLQLPLL